MAAVPYFALGSLSKPNIVLSLGDGPVRITVEVMLLLHLVAAFPIITNPPAQYFENVMNIPSSKKQEIYQNKWKYINFASPIK
jgi:hypothetical protein